MDEIQIDTPWENPSFWLEPAEQKKLEEMADLNMVGGKVTQRLHLYEKYENFYNGDQEVKILRRAQQYLQHITGISYSENICDLVVDAMADRLTVKSWVSAPDNTAVVEAATKIWDDNNMDEVGKTAVSRTIELGDGFLVVDYDEKAKMATMSFNPPNMMKAEYDPADPQKMTFAVKRWCEDTVSHLNPQGESIERMNVYYNERIERYFSVNKDGEWMPFFDVGEEFWPIPWTKDNEPDWSGEGGRGIPVFHLKNKPRGKSYGRSELQTVIPLQCSLNKLWLDLFEVADQQGYPQRYGSGISKIESESMTSGSGVLWTSPSVDTKFGQFAAADLNQLVNLIDTRYRTISGTTYTPIHMLVMAKGVLSGEALKKSESGLIAKIKDRQPGLGHEMGRAMHMAIGLMVDNGEAVSGFDFEKTKINPEWTEAENVDEGERIEVAEAKKRVGVPLERVLEELGYEDVPELLRMLEAEQDKIADREIKKLEANSKVRGEDNLAKEGEQLGGKNNAPKPK